MRHYIDWLRENPDLAILAGFSIFGNLALALAARKYFPRTTN